MDRSDQELSGTTSDSVDLEGETLDCLDLQHRRLKVLRLIDCKIDEVKCEGTSIDEQLVLEGCEIDHLVLRGARIPDRAEFHQCIFTGSVSFAAGASLASGEKVEEETLMHIHFDRCTFQGYTTFNNRLFLRSPSWTNCDFQRPPAFLGSRMHPGARFDDCNFRIPIDVRTDQNEREGEAQKSVNKVGRDSMRAFRNLRNIARDHGDLELANECAVLELETRLRLPATSFGEKLLLRSYRALSRFGTSIGRPILALLLLFSVGVFGLALLADQALSLQQVPLVDAARFGISQLVVPFSAFEFDYQMPGALEPLPAVRPYSVLLVGGLLSSMTFVTLGLVLFSIRRRFVG